MSFALEVVGNSAITILNPMLYVDYGDFNTSFVLSAAPNADQTSAFVQFLKSETGTARYQDLVPLQLLISTDQIPINAPDQLTMYVGGKSYFLDIQLAQDTNVNVIVTITPSNDSLSVIGNNSFQLNSMNPDARFRLALTSAADGNLSYSVNYVLSGIYANLFSLNNNVTSITIAQSPTDLNSTNLNFTTNIYIFTRAMTVMIRNFNYPMYIYYQVYEQTTLNDSLEMTEADIIANLDAVIEVQIQEDNTTYGITFCNDTTMACLINIANLELKKYYFKCFAVSPNGIQSTLIFKTSFDTYRNLKLYLLFVLLIKIKRSNQ